MTRTITAAVTVAIMLVAGLAYSVSAQDDAAREAKDRVQIEALMWKYTRALDTANADAYAAVYTPDGQFSSGANATKGHEALKKMVADIKQRQVAAAARSLTTSRPCR